MVESLETNVIHPGDDFIPQARIAIWFRDAIVGWLVDSGIEYITGRAPTDWFILGYDRIVTNIMSIGRTWTKPIYVTTTGNVVTSCPPEYTCPIAPWETEPEDEK
ncbi:hypothetical protein ACERII_03475 [Evansella sp. AB-rgal1]|uniref:hypothetical protein n=1 Tax=Evansella sp. AB-rgal1 TaxID=3242696 RepID=UPI00359EB7B4